MSNRIMNKAEEPAVVRWENPPDNRRSKGRKPNPYYDAILLQLQGRPGEYARVGVFGDYGAALNVQQLLKNRGCKVTTRKDPEYVTENKIDVWACWPEGETVDTETSYSTEILQSQKVRLFWGKVPPKRSGIRK